ncbi:MAG: trypsin-like peptidase domain-containing protein [Candidatus Hydrogenedentes bacterium]|nr:trypsin-like peptidase domain-containing protein [Candidatus Hydrogenedentota bacterium]
MTKPTSVVLSIALLHSLFTTAAADELAEAARAVVERHASAVVTLKLVIEESMSFGEFEEDESVGTLEITATIIAPDGLIVTSLSQTDPAGMFESLFEDLDDDDYSFSIETVITDVRVLLSDGEEIPAKIVLRDRDLDLVFLRPEKPPAKPLPFVDLSRSASAQQFDPLITLRRLGKVANRQCAGSFPRVQAVMKRPRRMYVLESEFGSGLGQPAFSIAGDCIGITVLRSLNLPMSDSMAIFSDSGFNMATVVLPASDILEIAEQAKENVDPD